MAAALELCDVTRSYRAGVSGCGAAVRVLDGVSLRVDLGQVVGVVGEEGAGKTTLLLCAAGLLRPDAGAVVWFGARRRAGRADGPPAGVAFVPARASYYPFLTVREALDHYAALHLSVGRAEREREARLALERVGLADRCGERVARLASEALRRLAMAQALLARPRLLLLDAPLAGLDGEARRAVVELIAGSAREGAAVLLAARAARGLHGLVSRAERLRDGRLSEVVGDGELAAVELALELRVASPGADGVALARALAAHGRRAAGGSISFQGAPVVEWRGDLLRVALLAATPEEVLAHCRELGVVVYESRVVSSDLAGGERRVAERGA